MSILDLAGLVAAVRLAAVDHDELAARRNRAGDGTPAHDLAVNATRRPDTIEVTCAADHTTGDATYRVVVRGTFRAAEPFVIDDPTMTAFVQQVGVMTLYPFLRAGLRDLSTRIGAEPVVLDLIQPGQIRLGLQGRAGSN